MPTRSSLVPALSLAIGALTIGAGCVDVPLGVLRPRVGVVQLVQGNNQITPVGTEAIVPVLRLLAPDSTPMRGLEVRYTVGSSSVVSPATVRSDSLGFAQPLVWTVRNTAGLDTLTATVVGVGVYRFVATVTPPCVGTSTIVVGDSVNGRVGGTGCLTGGGRRATTYTLANTAPSTPYAVVMRMSGSTYRGRIEVQSGGVTRATTVYDTTVGQATSLALFAPPVPLTVLASGTAPGDSGTFSLATSANATYAGCPRTVFMLRGASSTQHIDDTNCVYTDGSGGRYYGQAYKVRLLAGERIVARMTSATLSCFILVLDDRNESVLSSENAGVSTAVALQFTAPVSGFYTVTALSANVRAVGGPYTLSIDP